MTVGIVDLFCGVGGLTCGLRQAGLNVVAGIDLDSECKYPYEHNNKSTFINENITEVKGNEILKLLENFDTKILVGCAPCQPFSNHQKKKKERSKHKDWKLLYEFSRIVSECMPDVVSMENVPELRKEKVFDDFVASLVKLGYYVDYKIVNAADYGVPQRRKRLLLLASLMSEIHLEGITHKKYVTVKECIGNLPPIEAGQANLIDPLHIAAGLSSLNLQRIKVSKPGGTWKDWPEELICKCHKKSKGKSYSSVYGRMKWDDVSSTITTQFIGYGTGRFGHPEQNRALTLREGAMIQTFPQNYSFIKDGEKVVKKNIARYIGNAVPPRLGEIIGESIVRYLKDNNIEV